jgi:hypothetical protein
MRVIGQEGVCSSNACKNHSRCMPKAAWVEEEGGEKIWLVLHQCAWWGTGWGGVGGGWLSKRLENTTGACCGLG